MPPSVHAQPSTPDRRAEARINAQAKREEYRLKAEVDANREREQRDADLVTNLAEMDRQSAIDQQKIAADYENNALDRQTELQREGMKQETEVAWMATQERIADKRLVADVQKAQATAVGKAIDRNQAPDGNRQGRTGK